MADVIWGETLKKGIAADGSASFCRFATFLIKMEPDPTYYPVKLEDTVPTLIPANFP
jgi:hypothetical protein